MLPNKSDPFTGLKLGREMRENKRKKRRKEHGTKQEVPKVYNSSHVHQMKN